MATLEAQAFEEKRENYVSSSESDDEGDGGVAAANIPPPFSDGLPQVWRISYAKHNLRLSPLVLFYVFVY